MLLMIPKRDPKVLVFQSSFVALLYSSLTQLNCMFPLSELN